MRVDYLSMFSKSQVLSAASADSDVLDIQKAGISEGVGYIFVRNETAVTGLATVSLQGSDDNGEDDDYADIVTFPVTDLTIGGGVNIPVPQGLPGYLKLVYKAAASSTLSGTVSAGFTLQVDSPRGKRIGDYEANPNFAV